MKNNLMDWHYANNQFENGTINSFKSMNILSSDHVSRLKASEGNTLFDELINFVSPVQDKFEDLYADWRMYKGIYHGHTLKFEQLMDELVAEKVPEWAGKIMAIYHDRTPEYQALFAQGRSIFGKGTYDDRISAVKSLAHHLRNYANLSELQSSVEEYYKLLATSRDGQQKNEGKVKEAASDLESARIVLAQAMYRNLGMLMSHFYKDPKEIIKYFELEHIQTTATKEKDNGFEEEEFVEPLNADGTTMVIQQN
jgi:CRISPR/Cas system CSM-associated protein Csm2 small subunit